METTERIIHEYVTGDGRNHFREWFDTLSTVQAQIKIDVRIGRIRLGVLLLCAGDKSSQKKDIKKAHAFWQDHTGGE